MKQLTEKWLLNHNPCKDGLAFAKSCDFDFAKIYETCERADWIIWLLSKSQNIDKEQSVKIAITFAENVLEIFEKKYPNNNSPRLAVEAAKAYIALPTDENRQNVYAAADAASAAAYAADARLMEYKWQANKVRKIIHNPYK